MTKKQRGGRRLGAGRKPLLPDELDSLTIGMKIENRIQETTEAGHKQSVGLRFSEELAENWRKLNSTPVAKRQKWNKRLTAKGLSAEQEESGLSLLLSDIAVDIGDQRHFPNPGKRAYGVRNKIICDVAKEESERLGLKIKPSFAEDCLEKYRRFLKWLDA